MLFYKLLPNIFGLENPDMRNLKAKIINHETLANQKIVYVVQIKD